MKKLNQRGFGVIEGLLVVVISGLIGGAGYYVYKANQNTKESLNNTGNSELSNSKSTNKENAGEEQIPQGFVKYTHKGLGFSFAYPQEWGNATTKKAEQSQALNFSGQKHMIIFSNSDVKAQLKSTDYEITGGGGSGFTFDGPSNTNYQERLSATASADESRRQGSDNYSTTIFAETSSHFIYGDIDLVGVGHFTVSLIKLNLSNFDNVAFYEYKTYQGNGLETKEVSGLVDQKTIEQFQQIAKTIKTL